VIAIPFLTAYGLVTFVSKTTLLRYAPQWSDEIFYWHQAATFRTAGFNGGYYTINEQGAPFSSLHFYCHGPAYPMLFGYIGRFAGWELYYAPIINIILLTSAITWFILTRKPDLLQLLFIALFTLAFWPMHLYMFTNMCVIIDISLSIIAASLFCKAIHSPDTLSMKFKIGVPLFVMAISLYKPTWSFLLLPYWIFVRKQAGFTSLRAGFIAVSSIILSFFLYGRITAPYVFGFVYHFSTIFPQSPIQGMVLFLQHTTENLRLFFNPDHPPLEILIRAQLLFLIFSSLFLIGLKKKNETAFRAGIFVWISCTLLAATAIFLHEVGEWRDFRLLAPFIYMAGLVFIVHKRFYLVGLMLAGFLLLFPVFLNQYHDFTARAFPSDRDALNTFKDEINPVIQYRFSDNAWDNTILVPVSLLNQRVLLGVPPGIGISWFSNPENLNKIKSKYLILDKTHAEILKKHNMLTYIRTTSAGDLYINPRSEYGAR
jgi:hypothetical protein